MKANTMFLLFLALSFNMLAQPTAITWQGKLLDNGGNAFTQNNVSMNFAIFDASSGGNQLWPTSGVVTKTVDVVQGLYSVQLGTGVSDDIAFTAAMFDGKTPWLEVKVGTETLPRTEITNVPFALISNKLSDSGWENPGEIGKSTPNTGKFTSLETGILKVTDGASDGKVLTSDADGNAGWATPYTELTNFIESNYSYSSVTGVKFTPNNGAANVDIVLQPKGWGAIMAQQPDGTATGGNNRGNNAVDLQTFRSDATQVASGSAATILGGANNTASGYSSTAMGYGTTASAYNSTSIGCETVASGWASTAMGYITTAPSAFETVIGLYNTSYTPSATYDWIATDRLFVVGNGTADDLRSNALTILKNANTTIGGSLTINGNGTNSSLTFPTGWGTNGQVLTSEGNGGICWASPYAGLTNFTESNYTYNTKTGVKFLATNAATDVDFIISPKGSGAIIARQPDGTTVGGNNRGQYAVDLQANRDNAARVASGDFAVIAGGRDNMASGDYSAAMGWLNSATGDYSVCSGRQSTAGGYASFAAGGQSNTASGNYSIVGSGSYNLASAKNSGIFAGYNNKASGDYSFVGAGKDNTASGDYAFVSGFGNSSKSFGENVLGLYSTSVSGDNDQFVSTDRLFVIGNGTANDARSNALTILKNANTTIGGSLTLNENGTGTSFAFPAIRGTSGQFLKTAGDGTTSWSALSKSDVGLGNVENTAISTWAGSSNITTVGTITNGNWNGNTVALNKGGTGATTKTAAFDVLSPITTQGDIIYGEASGTGTRLAKGTAGQVLTMNAGATAPQWSTPANGTVSSVTGTSPVNVATGTTTPVISVSDATTSSSGLMSAADKTKLDAQTTGTATGQMQYWNGTAWVTIDVGHNSQVLKLINGVPTWADDYIENLSIGDFYQGGIIAYFLQPGDPGYDPDVLHGIIAAPSDQSTHCDWGCSGTLITGADGTALGTGTQNTLDIIAGCNDLLTAALICSDLELNGYDDWYLPSKDELNKLYVNKDLIGGFSDDYYWCSTEYNNNLARYQLFFDGIQDAFPKSNTISVRAIRNF